MTDGKHGVSTDVYSYGVVGFLCVGMLVGIVCCGDCVESFTPIPGIIHAYSEQREDSKLVCDKIHAYNP